LCADRGIRGQKRRARSKERKAGSRARERPSSSESVSRRVTSAPTSGGADVFLSENGRGLWRPAPHEAEPDDRLLLDVRHGFINRVGEETEVKVAFVDRPSSEHLLEKCGEGSPVRPVHQNDREALDLLCLDENGRLEKLVHRS